MVDENISTLGAKPQDEQNQKNIIKEHLLFHKALITEDDQDDKLDQYMHIVEQLEDGMSIAFPDPFDRAIAITFELAITHHLDPWDVDLIQFSNEYLKHVRKEKDLDLVTAGRIILMAWKILKLQSDEVLINAQQFEEQEDDLWHEPDGDWYLNDDDFEYTTEVINQDDSPLQEMIWHKGKRRVSLLELVGAFEEAKREAKLIKILNERQAEEREKLKLFRRQNINNKLHSENLQDDMKLVYGRICKFNGHPIPLSDVYTPDIDDTITTLVSSLFLAYDRKIDIWQKKFPFGQIFVKNLYELDNLDCVEELEQSKNMSNLNEIAPEDVIEMIAEDAENDDKVLLKDLEFDEDQIEEDEEQEKRRKKRFKEELEDYVTEQKNIAS